MNHFHKVSDQSHSDSFKWNTREYFYNSNEVIPMSVADMDLQTAPEITEALVERAKTGIFGYPIRLDDYYNAFINWMKNQHDWEIERKSLVNISTIVPAINICIQEFTKEKDDIVILTPVYKPFKDSIIANNRNVIECELIYNSDKYEIDFDNLEQYFKSGCKFMIFCSPHNPVGRVWTESELNKLGELIQKYNVLMISDEIHIDIIYKNSKHIPAQKIDSLKNNTIIFTAPGKTFNIAGLHVSMAVIENEKIRNTFTKALNDLSLLYGNIFAISGFTAAYTKGLEWYTQLIIYLEDTKDYILNYIKTYVPKIKIIESEGTFLMWLDCRELFDNDNEIFDFFSSKAKIGLTPGTDFGKGGSGFMRLNFAYPRPVIEEAMKRIKEAYEQL